MGKSIVYRFVLTVAFITCGLISLGLKCKVDGTRPGNLAPLIKFANIPGDGSTFTSQPVVNWFGKDLDGFVDSYQYVVFKASQIESLGDSLGRPFISGSGAIDTSWINFLSSISSDKWNTDLIGWGVTLQLLGEEKVVPVELKTIQGAGQTSAQVQLFASAEPTQVILQFLFLRAVDNLGLSSLIIYRTFSRTNNPPNTSIDFNNKEVYYSRAETTATWKGINISWGGKDSIDYPIGDPPLEFLLKLFYLGPGPGDTLTPDTSELVWVSIDLEDEWVRAKSTVLPAGLQTGYYMFQARARDDAFIQDSTPARSIFYVIRPTFEKKILAVDMSQFFTNLTGCVTDPSLYRDYYLRMLSDAGHPTDSFWAMDGHPDSTPNERLLSHYQVVLVINQDNKAGVTDSLGRQLIKYLDVGGKVWITGIFDFTTTASFSGTDRTLKIFTDELRSAIRGGEPGYHVDLGQFYCGLEQYFMPAWGDDPDSVFSGGSWQDNRPNWPAYPLGRNEEFIGAVSLLPPPWPNLELDTNNVKLASSIKPNLKILLKDKLPHVNYAVFSVHPKFDPLVAQTIYLMNSSYGGASDEMNGKPVGIYYQGPTFQTAIFTFPLFYIKYDQSVELTRQLMNWFGVTQRS